MLLHYIFSHLQYSFQFFHVIINYFAFLMQRWEVLHRKEAREIQIYHLSEKCFSEVIQWSFWKSWKQNTVFWFLSIPLLYIQSIHTRFLWLKNSSVVKTKEKFTTGSYIFPIKLCMMFEKSSIRHEGKSCMCICMQISKFRA